LKFSAVDSGLASAAMSHEWRGRLALIFGCDRPKATQLQRSETQAPFKIQRPFYPEGTAVCHGVMLHTAGGVVGGDRLSVEVTLHPQAEVLLTTAAAAKIYGKGRREQPGLWARQTVIHRVEAGACLEWLPQETILFDGAKYHQATRVNLAEDALWMGWDITRLGRSARGERFASGEWRSHLEVWQGDRLIWVDPQRLQADPARLKSRHGLAGYPVVGTFALVGCEASQNWITAARQSWADLTSSNPAAEIGVTRLQAGMLCRYRGASTTEARRWFMAVWHLWRSHLRQRPACPPRVWPA
jgi:urease accessory protein